MASIEQLQQIADPGERVAAVMVSSRAALEFVEGCRRLRDEGIRELAREGLGYRTIAKVTTVPETTVRAVLGKLAAKGGGGV